MATNKDLDINVKYITRVEGHGEIVVDVKKGRIEKCEMNVVESPRLFEGMLRGRSIFEAQHITSRICGICACGHTLASIAAAEDALGFKPDEQTVRLRKLLLDYEILDSHLLHVYLLAAPDILGVKSFVPLIKTNNAVVRRALRMKKTVNDLCDILVGRHVHPISAIVGGFTKIPRPASLDGQIKLLEDMAGDIEETVKLAATLKFPEFRRETEYVALVSEDGEYPLLEGDIASSDGKRFRKADYRKATNEFVDTRSSAKFTKLSRDSYFTGALARFNLNSAKLRPEAKKAAETLGFKAPCHNPYLNTVAQVVEIVQCYHHALDLLREMRKNGLDHSRELVVGVNEQGAIPVKAGDGVGAVEVPRGLLIHNYETDEAGRIRNANCIIPTNQNVNNIQYDFKKLLPELLPLKSKEEITLALEMLVRAYDPCISCSAHYLNVSFIG